MDLAKATSKLKEPAKDAGKKPKRKVVDLGQKGGFSIRPGALHRALGVPEGEKLGQARITAALHSSKPEVRRMAASAKGLTHMK